MARGSRLGAALVLALCVSQTMAIKFVLRSAGVKCLSEDVGPNQLVIGDYSMTPPHSGFGEVEVKATGPDGAVLFEKSGADSGKFVFTSKIGGEHKTCFANSASAQKTVEFNLQTGVDAKDYSDIAKKDQLEPVQLQLRKLEDAVGSMIVDMQYLRGREESMRNTNESTNARVLWFSVTSMVVLSALGMWQLWYLKRFFRKKKMI